MTADLENIEVKPLSNNVSVRKAILNFEDKIKSLPNAMIGDSKEYLEKCPLKHSFVDGAYVRELFMPKGMLFVTKIHKITHAYFMMKGDCSILTEEGVKRIKGPFSGITKSGTKRVIYTHEDTIWITVHVTKKTDITDIENDIIAKTYDEVPNLIIDVESEENKITNFISSIKPIKENTDG